MRWTCYSLVPAAIWLAGASLVLAEAQDDQGLEYPSGVSQTSYDAYYLQPPKEEEKKKDGQPVTPSPSDIPVEEPSDENGDMVFEGMGCDAAYGCDAAHGCAAPSDCCCDPCGGCCCKDPCDHGDPWTLFEPCCCDKITAGGWISGGMISNAHGAPTNGTVQFNNFTGFEMTELWGWIEKDADTGGCGFDWGFRVDYVYGTDGPDTQAFGDGGWDFGWNSSSRYGSAIPQAYVEVAWNDLSVIYGHFFTIIGYEVVPAPDNFFFTHSYTMFYGEPFTHTGVLATYALGDNVEVYGGYTGSWDAGFEDRNDGSVFLGGVALTLTDNASLTWACTSGDQGISAFDGSDLGDIYMNSFVFEWDLNDCWTYVFQHDMGNNTGLGPGNNEWYGINQYLLYEINGCWSVGARFEWFRDDDGARVGRSLNVARDAGDYYEVTLGANYRPHANFVIRPELRYDWYNADDPSATLPFDRGTEDEQLSGGFDFIFTF